MKLPTHIRDHLRQAFQDARDGQCNATELHRCLMLIKGMTNPQLHIDCPPDPLGWSLCFSGSGLFGGLIRFRDGSWSLHT